MQNIFSEFHRRWKYRKVEQELKQIQKEELAKSSVRKQTLAFLACAADIQPSKDGWYVELNGGETREGGVVAQAMIIGKTTRRRDIRKGYDEDFDNHAVDELLKISATLKVAILYTHIISPIDPLVEANMLDKSIKKVSASEEQQRNGEQATLNSEYNKLNGKELRGHTATVFNGRDHYYHYGLCAAAFGKTRKDVDEIMDAISAKMDECGIRYEIPRYRQTQTIKSMLPGNYCDPNIRQPVSGRVAAQMLPLRALNPSYPEDGIIFGIDDTGKPVKLVFDKKDAGHIFGVGKTGSGKTVFECMIAARALAKGARVIILEPKNEDFDGTNYKNFCVAYNGKLLRMGRGGDNPNPFMVFYDSKVMGTSQASYDKALSDHFETLKGFMAAWIGPTFKNRMKGMFIKTLTDLYKQKGLIDDKGNAINTDRWEDPYAWPSFGELYRYWESLSPIVNRTKESPFDPSITALLYNTIEAAHGGTLSWIDNHNTPDLDNDLLVLDISALSLNLQNAFSVLMMGIINTRFFPKPTDGTPRRRTFVFFDEGAKLLKIHELKPFIEKMFRESRSAYITTGFFTQDTEGIGDDVLNFIKANCSNIFLLCNLKQSSIGPFKKVFNLKEEHTGRLLEEGAGIALYLKEPYAINMDIVLTDVEKKALLTEDNLPVTEELKAQAACGFAVEDAVKELYESEEFFVEDWVVSGAQANYPDYTYNTLQNPFSTGDLKTWIKTDKIKKGDGKTVDGRDKQDMVGVEGFRHYGAVCTIAGRSLIMSYRGVEIHHNDKEDISMYLYDENGKKVWICIEFEGQRTHDANDWIDKLKRAQKPDMIAERPSGFDHIIFTGTGATCKEMLKSKPLKDAGVVFPQGNSLLRQLEKIKDMYPNREPVNPDQFEAVTEQIEAC